MSLLLIALLGAEALRAEEFRVSSQKEFEAVRTRALRPGDRLLLRRGARFRGMLAPRGRGTTDAPIRVGAFGVGPRPRIDALGRNPAALLLRSPSFWEVSDLELTNTDGSDADQGQLFGVLVLADEEEGVFEHVHIDGCLVHDVNGEVGGKRRGGIHVQIRGLRASTFHDLRITNNRIERVGGVGIGNDSSCGRVEITPDGALLHHLWTKVYVADNHVEKTGRNCIIARVSRDAIYERNVLADSSRHDTGHSIFSFNTAGIRIQRNEAYGNVGEGEDRGGFDADYSCVDTVIQHNYSHDNGWFCGIMKRRGRNYVIRYNVSQNDTKGIYFYGFEGEAEVEGVHVYNNTHFVRRGLDVSVFPGGRTPVHTRFENNIFLFEGEGTWGRGAPGRGTSFASNVYFNLPPQPSDPSPIVVDPRLVAPGRAGVGVDLRTMTALRGYRLLPGSPCVDRGVRIVDGRGRDVLGVELQASRPFVGACAPAR